MSEGVREPLPAVSGRDRVGQLELGQPLLDELAQGLRAQPPVERERESPTNIGIAGGTHTLGGDT